MISKKPRQLVLTASQAGPGAAILNVATSSQLDVTRRQVGALSQESTHRVLVVCTENLLHWVQMIDLLNGTKR